MALDIAVIAFDGARLSSIGLFVDAYGSLLRQVNATFEVRERVGILTRARLLTPSQKPVTLDNGTRLAGDAAMDEAPRPKHVHVPDCVFDDDCGERSKDLAPVRRWLGEQSDAGGSFSSSGNGTRLLAAADILGRGPVCLSADRSRRFQLDYPAIAVDRNSGFRDCGRFLTARGPAHELPMFVHIIEGLFAPWAANFTANELGMDVLAEDDLVHDEIVVAARVWMGKNLSETVRIADLARHVGVSQGTLIRRFNRQFAMPPVAYMRKLRVDAAKRQLLETDRPIGQIANLVGYDDVKSFRTAFKSETGLTASGYRWRK